MNTPRIIHSSSAEGIPPPTFLIERKLPWVYTAVSDKDLSHATARLLVALSERFNGQYYDATGELFAWPSREYLMARAGIRSKDTFDRSVKQAEARGYLHVDHGQRRGQRRDVNRYFARLPQGPIFGPWPWPQGVNLKGRDLALEEKLISQGPISERSEIGPKESRVRIRDESLRGESKKEGFQGSNFEPSDSDSDSKKESKQTPEQAAERPEAGKGSSSSVVQYLMQRAKEEAAARAAAARAEAAKERDWTPSPHLEASLRKGRR